MLESKDRSTSERVLPKALPELAVERVRLARTGAARHGCQSARPWRVPLPRSNRPRARSNPPSPLIRPTGGTGRLVPARLAADRARLLFRSGIALLNRLLLGLLAGRGGVALRRSGPLSSHRSRSSAGAGPDLSPRQRSHRWPLNTQRAGELTWRDRSRRANLDDRLGAVYTEHTKGFEFEDRGETELESFDQPVRFGSCAGTCSPAALSATEAPRSRSRRETAHDG